MIFELNSKNLLLFFSYLRLILDQLVFVLQHYLPHPHLLHFHPHHQYILKIVNELHLNIHHHQHHYQILHIQIIRIFFFGVQQFVQVVNQVPLLLVLYHPILIVNIIILVNYQHDELFLN